MCGIAGLFAPGGAPEEYLAESAVRMTDSVRHRGPDGAGIWADAAAGIALGHRRLAILDLSPMGAQPMMSRSKRWVASFNGEIYNYRELRRSLGLIPRTGTDTEVLIESVEAWGPEAAFARMDGMFAVALWDRRERRLVLGRDRFGEKPIYYCWTGRLNSGPLLGRGMFAFGSELRTLETLADFEIDEESRATFLRLGYVPAPRSIYAGVFKLPPAHWMEIDSSGVERTAAYWRLPECGGFRGTIDDAVSELHWLTERSVRSRMVADVPVGAMLSGGTDSSLVVSAMPQARTFTIGFEEAEFDESAAAREVAQHFGTRHEEMTVTAGEALAVVPELADIYDEPFADSSQIPALLVSRLARRHVTVALAGDGGDELFLGYPRYGQLAAIARLPEILRQAAAPLAARAAKQEKHVLLAEALAAKDLASLYAAVMGAGAVDPPPAGVEEWMAAHDLLHYLPDDLLVKVDRAAMSVGLETRLPLLSPELAAFACSLPPRLRKGKRLLKRVLTGKTGLPERLVYRRKQGFMVPLAAWLRGPLKDWAESLVPGITGRLPAGSRCVRPWAELMLEAWTRRYSSTRINSPTTRASSPSRSSHGSNSGFSGSSTILVWAKPPSAS